MLTYLQTLTLTVFVFWISSCKSDSKSNQFDSTTNVPIQNDTLITTFERPLNRDSSIITKYLPKEYSLLDFVRGDITNDSIDDLIFICSKSDCQSKYDEWNNTNNTDTVNPYASARPLIILKGENNGEYTFIKQYDSLITPCGFDSYSDEKYSGIEIKNKKLVIDYYGGMCSRHGRDYHFIYVNKRKNWYLKSYVNYYHSACDGVYEMFSDTNDIEKNNVSIDSFKYNKEYGPKIDSESSNPENIENE